MANGVTLLFSEVLDKVHKAKTKSEKVAILIVNDNSSLRMVLIGIRKDVIIPLSLMFHTFPLTSISENYLPIRPGIRPEAYLRTQTWITFAVSLDGESFPTTYFFIIQIYPLKIYKKNSITFLGALILICSRRGNKALQGCHL